MIRTKISPEENGKDRFQRKLRQFHARNYYNLDYLIQTLQAEKDLHNQHLAALDSQVKQEIIDSPKFRHLKTLVDTDF